MPTKCLDLAKIASEFHIKDESGTFSFQDMGGAHYIT